jgi:hypothetical protein
MTTEPNHEDDGETEALRRLIENAERLSRGPATPQQEAIEKSFVRYRARAGGLSDANAPRDGYETGAEDPEINEWDPPRVRRGNRAALTGRNFFGVRGLLIGGAPVLDLVVVNSRRLEFTVPPDATSADAVLLYEVIDYTPREPDMELTAPSIEGPKAQ